MRFKRAPTSAAFSLLELVLVMAIVSVLTSLVFMRFSSVVHAARLQTFQRQLAQFDKNTRVMARQRGIALRLRFFREEKLVRREDEIGHELGKLTAPVALSRLDLRTNDQPHGGGDQVIVVSAEGRSEDYAIPFEKGRDIPSRYCLVLGQTGQFVTIDAEGLEHVFR